MNFKAALMVISGMFTAMTKQQGQDTNNANSVDMNMFSQQQTVDEFCTQLQSQPELMEALNQVSPANIVKSVANELETSLKNRNARRSQVSAKVDRFISKILKVTDEKERKSIIQEALGVVLKNRKLTEEERNVETECAEIAKKIMNEKHPMAFFEKEAIQGQEYKNHVDNLEKSRAAHKGKDTGENVRTEQDIKKLKADMVRGIAGNLATTEVMRLTSKYIKEYMDKQEALVKNNVESFSNGLAASSFMDEFVKPQTQKDNKSEKHKQAPGANLNQRPGSNRHKF